MNEQVNIICLYWVGKFRGRDYTANDVHRLFQSVEKYIDRPFSFYCLTNQVTADVPGTKIMLKHNWPGWWSKVELFRDDLPAGRTLYMDLDSNAVSGLGPILDTPGDLVMFNTRVAKHKAIRSHGLVARYQAATMLFNPGSLSWVYDKFEKDPETYMADYRSEQDMYGEWIPNQPCFPDKWLMKADQLRSNQLRPGTIIVTGNCKHDDFRNPGFAPWLDKLARGKEEPCTK